LLTKTLIKTEFCSLSLS